jgi:hypothetical protein
MSSKILLQSFYPKVNRKININNIDFYIDISQNLKNEITKSLTLTQSVQKMYQKVTNHHKT